MTFGTLPAARADGDTPWSISHAPAALILADDLTANLDSNIGHEISWPLRWIAKEQGRTVVIVSHDERTGEIADPILRLEDGAFKDKVTMAIDPVYVTEFLGQLAV